MTDVIDIKALRARAAKLGYRIRKQRNGKYELISDEGNGLQGPLEFLAKIIAAFERGEKGSLWSACGMPLCSVAREIERRKAAEVGA